MAPDVLARRGWKDFDVDFIEAKRDFHDCFVFQYGGGLEVNAAAADVLRSPGSAFGDVVPGQLFVPQLLVDCKTALGAPVGSGCKPCSRRANRKTHSPYRLRVGLARKRKPDSLIDRAASDIQLRKAAAAAFMS
jgi:hypothetical protein